MELVKSERLIILISIPVFWRLAIADSWQLRHARHAKATISALLRALYIPAVVAMRPDPHLKAFYEHF
jgi:hypothetical protein